LIADLETNTRLCVKLPLAIVNLAILTCHVIGISAFRPSETIQQNRLEYTFVATLIVEKSSEKLIRDAATQLRRVCGNHIFQSAVTIFMRH